MKNKKQTTKPANPRRPQSTEIRPPRPAYRLMPKAPHHDLLFLGFYPGMARSGSHTDHPTAA